jgi:hypothetical protein
MGEYLEENIIKYIIEIIHEQGIVFKFDYIQINNTPNNNTIIKHVLISKLLSLSLYLIF